MPTVASVNLSISEWPAEACNSLQKPVKACRNLTKGNKSRNVGQAHRLQAAFILYIRTVPSPFSTASQSVSG
jgi:hypothetical protein